MNQHIARLDRSLARRGEDAVLRRVIGTTVITNIDVQVRAFVRPAKPNDLVGTVLQTDSTVILSTTQIRAAQWPGGELATVQNPTPGLPRAGDKVVIQQRVRNITFVKPIGLEGEISRIELTVSG